MEYMKKMGEWDNVVLMKTIPFISSGNGEWFCRVWLDCKFGQAYHKNKFTAYRLAKNDLINQKINLKQIAL